MKVQSNNLFVKLILLISFILSTSCTTLDGPKNPNDPYESYNRNMHSFNEGADKYVIKPIAEGYNAVMPDIASTGVTNFFNNLDDIVVFINEIFQFKFSAAVETSARFVFNTTFGLFGLIDVSTGFDLPKHNEDFGQTLAYWGVGSGNYIVLPFIGPSTLRDTAGLAVDWTFFDPVFNRQTLQQTLVTLSVKYTDKRANLIAASNIIDDTVPDKYAFIRDAWLQRREFLIYDGNPPEDETFSDDELFDDDL